MAPSTPLADGQSGCGGASLGAAMPWNWAASGVISTNENNPWEHPLRQRILQVLDAQPGLAYRELQRELGAANGTLGTTWMCLFPTVQLP